MSGFVLTYPPVVSLCNRGATPSRMLNAVRDVQLCITKPRFALREIQRWNGRFDGQKQKFCDHNLYLKTTKRSVFGDDTTHLQSFIQGPLYRGIVCSFLKKRCWHLDLVFSWQGFSSSFPGSLPKPQRCQIGWFVWHLDLPVCVSNGFVSGCHFTILLGFKDGTPWMVSG